jgi:hypothetical protein
MEFIFTNDKSDQHKVCQTELQMYSRIITTKYQLADAQTNKRAQQLYMRIDTYIHIISFHPPKGMYSNFL